MGFALLVYALHEDFEFCFLVWVEDGADAGAALLAKLFALGFSRGIGRADLCARLINDDAELLLLIGGELKFAREIGDELAGCRRAGG